MFLILYLLNRQKEGKYFQIRLSVSNPHHISILIIICNLLCQRIVMNAKSIFFTIIYISIRFVFPTVIQS